MPFDKPVEGRSQGKKWSCLSLCIFLPVVLDLPLYIGMNICEVNKDGNGYKKSVGIRIIKKSTHSTPRSEARGTLRVDTERRFLH